MSTVKTAAVQVPPVFLDRDATVDKALEIIGTTAAEGAGLIVFPEAFVPAYPDWVWRTRPWDHHATALYSRLLQQSVEVPGAATAAIGAAARETGTVVSIGVNERVGSTLFNTQLLFGPDGALLSRHRKLVPTGGERLVWGSGDGSTLEVVDTPVGRIGTLTCWENYMPLARAALYAQGVEIYLAPTWYNSEMWVVSMRHIAHEARAFVVGVNHCIRGSDVPAAVPGRDELYGGDDDWLSRGNTLVADPDGTIVAGPLIGEAGIVTADIDPATVHAARMGFDPVGHYSRADVLSLVVDTSPRDAVTFRPGDGR